MYAVYWLIASAVFLLVEIMTLGLTSIWFAGGAVVAAITALFGVPFWVQHLSKKRSITWKAKGWFS